MAVIAEFTLAEESFALGSAMADASDVTVELDRIVPAAKPGIPYIWATGGDFDAFERVVRRSSIIDELTLVDRTDDSALYRIDWVPDGTSLVQEISGSNVTLIEAYRDGEQWFFRLRFDDHEDLTTFHAFCSEREIDYELTRVYPDGREHGRQAAFGLTQQQFDALVLAVDRGYFRVPRDVTLRELGDELGISQQAASERVRRATDAFLRTTLLGSSDESMTS